MNVFNFLFNWYNVPFLVALGAGLALILLQLVGGFGDSDGDLDLDVDGDVDGDIDGDGFFGNVLGSLGLGKVPLALVMMSVLLTFGCLGLLLNTLFTTVFVAYPQWVFFITLLITMLLTVPIAGRIVSVFARLAPDSSTAVGYEQLVGRLGIVVSSNVSATYGRVQVRDNHGSMHTIFAISEQGDLINEQTEVAILSYDAQKRHFLVRSMGRIA